MISHTFQHSSTIQLRSGPSSEAPELSTYYPLWFVKHWHFSSTFCLVHSAQVPRCRYLVEIVEYTKTVWDSAAVRQCGSAIVSGGTGDHGPLRPSMARRRYRATPGPHWYKRVPQYLQRYFQSGAENGTTSAFIHEKPLTRTNLTIFAK